MRKANEALQLTNVIVECFAVGLYLLERLENESVSHRK